MMNLSCHWSRSPRSRVIPRSLLWGFLSNEAVDATVLRALAGGWGEDNIMQKSLLLMCWYQQCISALFSRDFRVGEEEECVHVTP